MKKTYLALILVMGLILSMVPVSAFAASDDVEIKFAVGDDTLVINGNPVTVVTPYVVDGVTLVPVRVITEAFGAKVGWVEETQTVTLDYPDVNIVLQIGNPVAEVNGKATELLAAPELKNASTMVPLRFISENFGAVVTYDEATEKITVVKTKGVEGSGVVEGGISNSKIGDSYYGWSMNNPVDMSMTEREFDGTYTSFEYDENNWLVISIYYPDDEYNFDESFNSTKNTFNGYTLVKQDKKEIPGCKKMNFQAKSKTEYIEYYEYKTDKYLYEVIAMLETGDAKRIEEVSAILASFDVSFSGEDIYDLSNVKNNMRTFTDEDLKVSFDIPETFTYSDGNAINRFEFYNMADDDDISNINFSVYSKNEGEDVKSIATKNLEENRSVLNERISKLSDKPEEKTYGDITAYEYSVKITAKHYEQYVKDVFFEKGEYFYNMYITMKDPKDNWEEVTTAMLNSIKVEELDSSVTGQFIRNIDERTGVKNISDLKGVTVTIPNTYDEYAKDDTSLIYIKSRSSMVFTALNGGKFSTYGSVKTYARDYFESLKREDNTEVIKDFKEITYSNKNYVKFTIMTDKDEKVNYTEFYATFNKGSAYIFMVVYPELGYSENAREEVIKIITSARYDK